MKKLILLTVAVFVLVYIDPPPNGFRQLFNKFKIRIDCHLSSLRAMRSFFSWIFKNGMKGHKSVSNCTNWGNYLGNPAYT